MDHFWDVFVMKEGDEGKARTRAARAKGRSKERANEEKEKEEEEGEENEQSPKGRANAKRRRNQRIWYAMIWCKDVFIFSIAPALANINEESISSFSIFLPPALSNTNPTLLSSFTTQIPTRNPTPCTYHHILQAQLLQPEDEYVRGHDAV